MSNISIIPTLPYTVESNRCKRIAVGGFSAFYIPMGHPVLTEVQMMQKKYPPIVARHQTLKNAVKVELHRNIGVKVYYFIDMQ